MKAAAHLHERVDLAQQRSRPAGFLIGVLLRYRDDRGGRWVALIAYYGFFSIFPLLLSFVTVLGIVLEGRPSMRADIVDSALGNFPVIGTQLNEEGLTGSPVVVAIGLLTALWAGLGAAQTLQDAMNTMWSVPPTARPSFVAKRVRSLALLAFVAVGIVGASAVTSIGASGVHLGRGVFVLTIVGSIVVNIVLIGGAYRILTHSDLRVRDIYPGAISAGLALFGLQALGVILVTRVLDDAKDVYGVFATVMGLLTWIGFQAQVVLLGNEINVVRAKRLWPRSIRSSHPTEADVRALRDVALREISVRGIDVDLDITVRGAPGAPLAPPTDGTSHAG
jgi:YihY family inner membrane protein